MTVEAAPSASPVENFRKDYHPLPFHVSTVEMNLDLHPNRTTVTTLTLQSNPGVEASPLILNGQEETITLKSIRMDGRQEEAVLGKDYALGRDQLTLLTPKDGTTVTTVVEICPETNTALQGLYKSSDGIYCTQCEAMGFRRITFFPDRPDNMAVFQKVRLEANARDYPVLLSNGNLLERGPLPGGERHYAIWQDPFPKPSYLFAAVAGDLGQIQDTYETTNGRKVALHLYSEHNNVDKLQWALESLKRAMKWDEDRFGLEYDLDLFNIVAVSSFNMGAMENKSLNVFNTSCVLADYKTATDANYERIEGIIGHEYFHNWTGNRVTCRDWFQLTLKEGLTVFRDQEFSGDTNSKAVKRIEDVVKLRSMQFPEDASPMSHPIRPESYIAMDNFYTSTVYNKGAEVIRMYQTILGVEGFNRGMKLYFERHDGSAVTCDDFLAAMADANGMDLSHFAQWYSTKGTPTVQYTTHYDSAAGVLELTLSQTSHCPTALHIPIAVGLIDKESKKEVVPTKVLDLKEAKQTFSFDGIQGEVVPSLLRHFSAPIKLLPESGQVEEETLAFLAAYDTDGFNRWESGQQLFTLLVFQYMKDGKPSEKTMGYVMEAFGRTLADKTATDLSIVAYTMILPSESTLAEDMPVVDPIGIHKARGDVKKAIAREFQTKLQTRYDELTAECEAETEFVVNAAAIGRRRLRNVLLDYLCAIYQTDQEQEAAAALAKKHYDKATGMTDKMAAFNALASMDGKGAATRDEVTKKFFEEADNNELVLDKWFAVQGSADLPDVLNRVRELTKHPKFTLKNPNRMRSLIGAFSRNEAAFHAADGSGYKFIGEILAELDSINPTIASRLGKVLIKWRRYDPTRGAMMKGELEKLNQKNLSKDLFEVVSSGLK